MSSTVLELAISMIFLYLMLSAASSAIQEIIANIFRWRADTLEKGIEGLLGSDFKKKLYDSPLIRALYSPNARGQNVHPPSYIAADTFALAVLGVAGDSKFSLAPTPGAPATSSADKAEALLKSLLLGAADVQEQRKRIEDWFNHSMDRVSGWYKRTSYAWLWVIGIVICLLVNADSITLGEAFWNDPTLRAATTAAATEYVKKNPQPQASQANNTAGTPATGTTTSTPPPGCPANTNSSDDAFKRLDQVKGQLSTAQIPLGWCWNNHKGEKECFPFSAGPVKSDSAPASKESVDPRLVGSGSAWWLWKLLGIALTALAISQGAPFWFDMLQKFVNLRLAGDPPAEKKSGS